MRDNTKLQPWAFIAMRAKKSLDASRLASAVERAFDAILQPNLWPAIFQDVAEATNSTGITCFEFGTDSQKGMILCSPSLDESVETYVKEGWYLRNTRLPRAVRFSSPTRLVSDKDLATVHDPFDEADRAWRNDSCAGTTSAGTALALLVARIQGASSAPIPD